jgi:hypothetical protein
LTVTDETLVRTKNYWFNIRYKLHFVFNFWGQL